MCAPSPPPAPDYAAAAQQQGQANIQAAVTQGKINNPNVVSPLGSQSVSYNNPQTDVASYNKAVDEFQKTGQWTGSNGISYSYHPNQDAFVIPGSGDGVTPTITQTLNPNEQQILAGNEQAKIGMNALANQGVQSAQGIIGSPVDFSGAPAAPVPGQVNQAIVDAMMKRPMADYQRAKDQSSSDLAAAGIPVGSSAYNTQNDLLNRQLTDAQTQAEIAGVNAGQTAFNQGTTARQNAIANMLLQRQTPLNEITALESGSQVTNPFAIPGYAQNANVQAAPVFAATQQAANYGTDVYNTQAAQAGNLQSGLFGLAGAGVTAGGSKGGFLRS